MGTGSYEIFPLRVRVSYNFGLMGEDFSSDYLESGEAPTIFINTDNFEYDILNDGPKVIRNGLKIEFRKEEKNRIKEYFSNLVENSWDKMESFFGSYGVKLPEKEKVSRLLSKSFIEYLSGVTNFFNGIFANYDEIRDERISLPVTQDDILRLASEASSSCSYSIRNNPPHDLYVHIYFDDIEETHRLKRLKSINLTKEDLDHLESGRLDELRGLAEKSKAVRNLLENLAKSVFYGYGFQYLDTERIDEVVHLALSMGGRFYSLFPKVETTKGPRDKEEFLITTNIVDRTARLSGSEVPFPAILVSIETSVKGENGKEVSRTIESEGETKEVGPIRVGFGFLIELSNTVLEKRYVENFYEDEIIEKIEFYTDTRERDVIVEYYGFYHVYLRTRISLKSGAMWCPAAVSYIRTEERVFEKEDLNENRVSNIRVPKVFFTSLVFESPESKDLDLDSFVDIYRFLSESSYPEKELILESLLPRDSLVTSVLSSYLAHMASKESVVIVPPFGLYNVENVDKEYLMEKFIGNNLTPIAVKRPEKRENGKEYKRKSDRDIRMSDLDFYKYFISNSEVIGDRLMLYPFVAAAIAEKYLFGGESELCFSQDGKIKVKITPKSWEDLENEIKKNRPFKRVDEAGSWEYRSKERSMRIKDEILSFPDSDVYSVEKTKLSFNYDKRVKEKISEGLFYVLSWAALADLEEVGDVEKVRKKLFGK